MNIFAREMKANRKSLIIWCIGMIAMIAAGMSKFAGLTGAGGSINEMLDILPKSLLNMLGMSNFDLATAIGFYGILFLYLAIIATIHAVMLGASIIAKEESDKTAEFLLVKPVSRTQVVSSKLLAALINIFILNIVTFIASLAILGYFNEGDAILGDISMLMLGMFFLQLIFLSIGALLASVSKQPKSAASTAAGILLLTFMLAMIVNMNEKLDYLKYLTPFKYFEAESILLGNGFDYYFVILSAVIITISLAGTYGFYNKRDLSI